MDLIFKIPIIFAIFLNFNSGQELPDPIAFQWREGDDCANLNCPSGNCMNVTLPLTDPNGQELLLTDDFCLKLRPGHQWTWEFNWTNPIFAGLCNEPYDGFVIRNSPFQAFFGVDGILIWVITHYSEGLIFVQKKTNFGIFYV